MPDWTKRDTYGEIIAGGRGIRRPITGKPGIQQVSFMLDHRKGLRDAKADRLA